jgi:mitochondrial pyruvate carrier 2
MPATTTLFRAARPAFQSSAFGASRAAHARATFQRNFSQSSRRFQSTTAGDGAAQQSWFRRMWDSPIGFKTVHFWAPVLKWALVLAGVSDFARPAEKLSLTQNGALTATGLIWTRWCFVITPKNYL